MIFALIARASAAAAAAAAAAAKREEDKKIRIAIYVTEFDEFYRKYEGRVSDSILINEFLSNCPEMQEELRPLLEESVWLRKTLSLTKPMPEEVSKRVWARIKKKLEEMKKEKEEAKAAIPLGRRADFLILLLYAIGRRKFAEGIRGITRLMKYLFLIGREKGLLRYFKDYYQFAPHRLGPFDKRLYDDLAVLKEEGLVEKVLVRRVKLSPVEKEITDFFEPGNGFTEYRLTEKGVRFAKKLVKGIDKEIVKGIQEIKVKYGKYPLLRLLEYIYEVYPEYQEKSKVWEKIKKLRKSKE